MTVPQKDPLTQLSEAGVAVWLDDLSRDCLISGNLTQMVRDNSVVGVTTNASKSPMFSVDERLAMVQGEVTRIDGAIEVVPFDALLMHFAQEQGAEVIIRGLRAVAEGVEYQGLLTRLTELGCDVAQGYYISRPLPTARFEQWMASYPLRATWLGDPEPAVPPAITAASLLEPAASVPLVVASIMALSFAV